MAEKNKLGFWKRIWLAITDFRFYPFVQREKASMATKYLMRILLVISLFVTFSFSTRFFTMIDSFMGQYDEVPNFTFEEGNLTIEQKTYELDGENKFVMDTSMTNQEFIQTEVGKEVLYAKGFFVINQDGILFTSNDMLVAYSFQNWKGTFTKDNLWQMMQVIQGDAMVRVAIFFTTWLLAWILYMLLKLGNILILILVAWIFNSIFRMRLKFTNYYRVVVYALTLPLIIETATLLYLGRVPEYATIAYQLLAYVYIFYALRAMKLDLLLLGVSGGSMKEKIETIIHKLENEAGQKLEQEKKETKESQEPPEEKKEEHQEPKE